MNITIINGDPDPASPFQAYLQALGTHLAAPGHAVTTLELRSLDLKGCSGCWSCWVKTPGTCAKGDDSALLCRSALASDLLVVASPVIMGFTSALLKRAMDQMIPLVHPYFEMEGGELHHRPRYQHYPHLAVLLDPDRDTDGDDLEICADLWGRLARNLKLRSIRTAVTDRPAQEVAHAFASAA